MLSFATISAPSDICTAAVAGRSLALVCGDDSLRLFDLPSLQLRCRRHVGRETLPQGLCFSANGRVLVHRTLHASYVYRVADNGLQMILHFPGCFIEGTSQFTPDGSMLVMAHTNSIKVWAITPDARLGHDARLLKCAKVSVSYVSVSMTRLATINQDTKTVLLFDVPTLTRIATTTTLLALPTCCHLTKDRLLVASFIGGILKLDVHALDSLHRLWRVDRSQQVETFRLLPDNTFLCFRTNSGKVWSAHEIVDRRRSPDNKRLDTLCEPLCQQRYPPSWGAFVGISADGWAAYTFDDRMIKIADIFGHHPLAAFIILAKMPAAVGHMVSLMIGVSM
jgi:WD40 repeat protein